LQEASRLSRGGEGSAFREGEKRAAPLMNKLFKSLRKKRGKGAGAKSKIKNPPPA